MTTLFEDRERAAEYGYKHDEEMRFLALREGTETVARWAAQALGKNEEAGSGYVVALIGRLVSGVGEADLLGQVRLDLRAGGRPDLADEVGSRFTQAVATASDRLHGTLPARHEAAVHRKVHPAPHAHGFWGWTV